jgi:anti-sigma factor RsiW
MAEQHCIYPDRESVLVAYLYGDDIATIDRVAFDTHLATCERCRTELADFRDVRSNLAQWAAPESARTRKPPVVTATRWWTSVPVWAQVAAAILVLGVSASIANLDVRYDRANGLRVTTGWSATAPAVAVAPAADANAAPWRAELAAMQQQLRTEMRTQAPAVVAASATPGASLTDA